MAQLKYKTAGGLWEPVSSGGGTSDYTDLTNKPSIESVTLSGNKTAADLGLAKSTDIPSVPSASSSTPQPLGTAAAGSSGDYSRADHVHAKPTAADVGAIAEPATAGTNGQVLTSDGNGGQSWQTPASGGVSDVQVNGTSVVTSGVANVPKAANNVLGVVKTETNYGVMVNANGRIYVDGANALVVKKATDQFRPVVPYYQHVSTFYALAKAAGDSTQSASENAVGVYTDEAIDKILTMLGVIDLIAPHETSSVALRAYAQGACFIYLGKLYRATSAISISDAITPGTNCIQTTIMEEITR